MVIFQEVELRNLLTRQAYINSLPGHNTRTVAVPPLLSNPTPSPDLLEEAAAQGVSVDQLSELTPFELAKLQAMFDSIAF